MLIWPGLNLHESFGFPFCSSQYVGLRLGRAGYSSQSEATWEAEDCLLRWEKLYFSCRVCSS